MLILIIALIVMDRSYELKDEFDKNMIVRVNVRKFGNLMEHFKIRKKLRRERRRKLLLDPGKGLRTHLNVQEERDRWHGINPLNREARTVVSTNNDGIPLDIYMLWDKGWDHAPELQKLARRSWEIQNPTFQVHALNLTEAETLAKPNRLFPDWHKLTIQAKSDVLRVILLFERGGVWVDSSVFCNRPLLSWFNVTSDGNLGSFFTFLRNDNKNRQLRLRINPWITSWFMVSTPRSPVLLEIMKVFRDRKEHFRMRKEYFWLHRIVAEKCSRSPTFASYIRNLPTGDGPHCVTKVDSELGSQPMFKRCNTENWQYLYDNMVAGVTGVT
jgi:mannosyltransferase OCH1-like enzyme